MLLRGLPRTSMTWRNGNWSQQDELLARLIESVDFWGWISACQHGAGKVVPKPEPVWHPDRPGSEPQHRPATTDPREINRFFRQFLNPN